MDSIYKRHFTVLAVCTIIILLLFKYYPVLSGKYSIGHGDSFTHSLPVQKMLSDAIKSGRFPLWSSQLYGGHPFFAESQGGYAQPLNFVIFSLLPPIWAHNFYAFLLSLITGLGMYALCRSLKIEKTASLFAALALMFSDAWIGMTYNACYAQTMAFIPLTLLAMERWWDKPTFITAGFMALAFSQVILGGYLPSGLGLAIFMICIVCVRATVELVQGSFIKLLQQSLFGIISAVICLGLVAIQIIPMFELVDHSIRKEAMQLWMSMTVEDFLRGLFVTTASIADGNILIDKGMGSTLVFSAALLSLAFRNNSRYFSYFISSFVVFQLGLGENSFLYPWAVHWMPLLDKFRVVNHFLDIGFVGIVIMAAFFLHHIVNTKSFGRKNTIQMVIIFVSILILVHELDIMTTPLVIIGIFSCILTAALIWFKKNQWIKWLFLGVIIFEVLWFRVNMDTHIKTSHLKTPPAAVTFLKQRHPGGYDFKIYNLSKMILYALLPPHNPNLDRLARNYLSSLEPSANLLWGLSSMGGTMALPLSRSHIANTLIKEDLSKCSQGIGPISKRSSLIDNLSIRYITMGKKTHIPGLEPVFSDPDFNIALLENKTALPLIRFHANADFVETLDEAVVFFEKGYSSSLLIETPSPPARDKDYLIVDEDPSNHSSLVVLEKSDESYLLKVDTQTPGFIFFSDAYYPGWEAYVNDIKTSVYPANILGKAVHVPAGLSEVRVVFRSRTFLIGAIISACTLLLIIIAGFLCYNGLSLTLCTPKT